MRRQKFNSKLYDTFNQFHNEYNYHSRFTREDLARRAIILNKFVKTFTVLDWSGQTYKEGECNVLMNLDFPMTWNNIMEKEVYNKLLPYKDDVIIAQIKEKFGTLRIYVARNEGSKLSNVIDIVQKIEDDANRKILKLYKKSDKETVRSEK